jgi:hypothetical protein
MTDNPAANRAGSAACSSSRVRAGGCSLYSLQFHPEREDWAGQRAQLAQRKRPPRPARIDPRRCSAT